MTADSSQNGAERKRRGKPSEPATTEQPFEAQLEELDSIVTALEDGQLPLEEALALYERGMRLAKASQERLDAAELRVRRLRVVAPDDDGSERFALDEFEADE